MDVETWIQRKNNITRRRFLELHLEVLSSLPADRLTFYLNDLRETSARKIQTAWRGYRARRTFSEIRTELVKERAAITIQRRVRHWLHNRAEKKNYSQFAPLTQRISEDRLQVLQDEVCRWQDNHDNVIFPGMKEMTEAHLEVQKKLTNFYWKAGERNNRQQSIEMKCAQLEAISMLMKDLPALSESENVDFSWYHCSSLPLATAARLSHKQKLRSLSAPWWSNLKM
ncbi:IQ calmodulin-binding motif-containing protein 1-like [Periplaneta americana]|uniref:IQ calmodulin-binding motif-containing protein 1-like n=1 Tax=Periplaneta americana TaxID=6978 RepID=UPI0037E7FB07